MNGLEPISADMIDFYAGRPDVAIIDLRTEQEYAAGHIRAPEIYRMRKRKGRYICPDRKYCFCTANEVRPVWPLAGVWLKKGIR
mgnify:CR=1 FL=1